MARIHLQVRRFRCDQSTCPRTTFAECLPDLVEPLIATINRGVCTNQEKAAKMCETSLKGYPQIGLTSMAICTAQTPKLRKVSTHDRPARGSCCCLPLVPSTYRNRSNTGSIAVRRACSQRATSGCLRKRC